MRLSPVEVRILGSLIEKESTTPDNYPLSLNALTAACNQLTNREPVMQLSEIEVRNAVNNLRQQSLVRAIQPSDSRVLKFRHLLTEKLELDDNARAVLCVLMLRGAQTAGEIKSRTARLAEFGDLGDVEATLEDLRRHELAAELPRRAGQKEARFVQLLSEPSAEPAHEDLEPRANAPDPADRIAALEATVTELRSELAELRRRFEEFRAQFG